MGLVAALAGATSALAAQIQRPRVDVTAVVPPGPVKPGTTATVSVKVTMPKDIHVQSDKPRDPLLIPTVLTVTPPSGVTVERIVYPKPSDFTQIGSKQPLTVFGPAFSIEAQLSFDANVAAGELRVPAELRYQACNDKLCFPPARAALQWTVKVEIP